MTPAMISAPRNRKSAPAVAWATALAFAEIRRADGIDEFGQPGEDVFVLGLQYGFARAGAFSYP